MTQGKTHREPLLRIAKRDGIARPKAWAIRIIAVLLSLVVSGIFIFAVTKLNPFQVYEGIFDGALRHPPAQLGYCPGRHDAAVHRRGACACL